ncbi:hypothetical protein JCM6882_005926 [Rhodosporidiobolus microsporus]
MADPPKKAMYSIFQRRPKPPPAAAPPQAAPAVDDPVPPPPAPLVAATPVEPPAPTQKKPAASLKSPKPLAVTGSTSSRVDTPTDGSIVLSDDDDEDGTDGSATATSSVGSKRSTRAKADKPKAKKAKKVVEDSDDDLVIVDTAAGRKKRGKPVDGKAKKGKAVAESPKKKNGKKRDNGSSTIDLTLSPTRSSASSSFGTGFAPLHETYKKDRERRKANEGVEARWPTREEHGDRVVEREQPTEAQKRAAALRSRRRSTVEADEKGKGKAREEQDGDFLADYRRQIDEPSFPGPSSAVSPTLYETHPLSSVPALAPSFPPHPLLNRLAAPLQSPSATSPVFSRPGDAGRPPEDKLWTVKYGPQKAEEVLGSYSGASAMHLREWLEELKVQSAHEDAKENKRRRPINRGITKPKKKKKKRNLDDFIASSSDEDDNAGPPDLSGYYDLDDVDPPGSSTASDDDELFPSSRRSPASVFPSLTNLLLLHGPHGSGKTSTVHAVAAELGYEVFEVFPGMGKRRAQDLERYVGDVGKNHLVRASPRKANGGMVNLFSMFGKQGEKGKGRKKAEDGEGDVEMKEAAKETKAPTQSLILFDEVDVLYTQEHDFWQGVVALAKESRRPIIMTCTDYSLVPFADLALQKVAHPSRSHLPAQDYLDFAPPEPALAIPYLQLISLLEGHLVAPSTLSQLYEDFSSPALYPPYLAQTQPGERPLPHPMSKAPLKGGGDLRKAVMQLEGELAWRGGLGKAQVGDDETRWQVGGLRVPKREGEEEEDVEVKKVEGGLTQLDGGTTLDPALEGLKRATVAAEALSAADALVDRRIRVFLEDDDSGRFTTTADLELSYPLLEPFTPRSAVDNKRGMLPFLGAESAMAHEMRTLATRVWRKAARFGQREDEELEDKRAAFGFSLAQLTQLQQKPEHCLIHPPWAPLLPHPVSSILYRPFLRAITLADDAHEAASGLAAASTSADAGGSGAGGVAARVRRSGRNQKKDEGRYERKLPWQSKVEADWLRGSGFPGQDDTVVLPPPEVAEVKVEDPAPSSQGEVVVKKSRTIEDDEE